MRFSRLLLALALALGLLLVSACGRQVELDPRDEDGLKEWACDTRSSMVHLDVINRSTFDVVVTIMPRSGSGRDLRPAAWGLKTTRYRVMRSELDSSGRLLIRAIRGGLSSGPGEAWLTPLMCDVGTLEINGTLNQSYYMGVEL